MTRALADAFERGTRIWRAVTAADEFGDAVRTTDDEIVLRRRGHFTATLKQLRLQGWPTMSMSSATSTC